MKKSRYALMTLVAAFLGSGCASTLIFRSSFSAGTGSPQGSPFGDPPGDEITVQSTGNPLLTAGHLTFDAPNGSTFFFSRPVESTTSTKTIYFTGHLTSGDGPFIHFVQAYNSVGTPFPDNPLELRFTDTTVEVRDPFDNVLHSSSIPANQPHDVFISLRLGTDTYRITIQQTGPAEIEFTGSLPATTANVLKRDRIALNSRFGPGASVSDTYEMDDVIMREP